MGRSILTGADRVSAGNGMELRLLSAMEVMQARREAATLMAEQREKALCSNACLLARALERHGKPVFASGEAALSGMSVEKIAQLAKQWAEFNHRENPSVEDEKERVDDLKKAWSTRLMSAWNGVCSTVLVRCPRRNASRK